MKTKSVVALLTLTIADFVLAGDTPPDPAPKTNDPPTPAPPVEDPKLKWEDFIKLPKCSDGDGKKPGKECKWEQCY